LMLSQHKPDMMQNGCLSQVCANHRGHMDVSKLHQHEACRFYYNPKKREVPQPRQVPRSHSEVVRFFNSGGSPSRSASSGNLSDRSFRRTHFQGLTAPRPTRDVLEACHFHLAAKTRRASPQPRQSIPTLCMRDACRFHTEPFSSGRSSPLRRAERTSPQAKGVVVNGVCADNAGFVSLQPHDEHVVIDLTQGPQHLQLTTNRRRSLGAASCRDTEPTQAILEQRSCSPHGRWHGMATVPSEQRIQRAHSWALERCRHIDALDGPTTQLADSILAVPSQCLASITGETRLPHTQSVGENVPCKLEDVKAASQAEPQKDSAHSRNSEQLLPQKFRKILHYVEKVPLLGSSASVTASAAPTPPRSYTQRRAAQKPQRRLSLPVTCKDSDMGCHSDLQALRQRRAPKWHKQPLLQP